MADKEYVCAYNHCLHHGEKVKSSEAVMIGKKRYHWDCAATKQEIAECASAYMEITEDKTQYPVVMRIINTLVFKNQVPPEYILKQIKKSKLYYKSKPIHALYGLRRLFWEYEMKMG